MDSPTPHVLTVEDLHALTTYPLELTKGPGGRPCVLLLRRIDVLTQFMEDLLPLPMFEAAMRSFEAIRAKVSEIDSIDKAVAEIPVEERAQLVEGLRRYACAVVLSPALSMDGAPGTFPVTLFSTDVLFAIWSHIPPEVQLPRLAGPAADAFRDAAEAAPGAPASASGDLRAAPGELRADAGAAHVA